ncbi:ArnT family glycosyltransferase [Tundrisphaera lichenicola]|uniref:ArnT family glycosyltransferase n=1 Tax=Tundrisphaera lichenicola TaxID=2029860 RepID=UPI003EBFBD35
MPLDLGFLILLTVVAAGLGLRVLAALRATPEHPLDAWALAVPLGLGILALGVLGLAELGWLTTGALWGLMAVGLLAGGQGGVTGPARAIRSYPRSGGVFSSSLSPWERAGVRVPDRPTRAGAADLAVVGNATTLTPALSQREREAEDAVESSTLLSWAFDLPLLIALVGTLLTALAPVTDGDALCYHLQVPKVFLARHSAVFEPDLHETIYPLVTESLYAIGLGIRGPVACRLIQWLLGVAFAANVGALARPFLGDRARWASSIALLVPAISNGMGAPLNDVALASFGNAAIFAWTRWLDRPSGRSTILVGLLMGLALGVKYPALVLAGVVGLGFLIRGKVRHALLFGLVALAIGGGWYLRAYMHTGNPVYPFFRQVFGGSGIDEVLDPAKKAMRVTAWNLLTALGSMTLRPGRFDSFSHQFGPAFLLFLPALLWMRPPRRVLTVVGVGYAFLLLCLTQRQSMRFVLTAVGPMAVGVAWLASAWWDRRTVPGRVLVGLLVACLMFEAGLATIRTRHGLSVVLGRESTESFLSRREPTFVVGRWIDDHLPEDSKIIGQDHRGFYLPRNYSMELAHRRRTGLGRRGESARQVVETLRAAGFTHVLLCPPVPEDAVEFDPTLGRLLGPWLDSGRPLYREDLADADGVVRRYAIFGLAESIEEAHR